MKNLFNGCVLKWILNNRGIKHVEFAMASGLPPSTVSGLLNGWLKAGPKTMEKVMKGSIALGLWDECENLHSQFTHPSELSS